MKKITFLAIIAIQLFAANVQVLEVKLERLQKTKSFMLSNNPNIDTSRIDLEIEKLKKEIKSQKG
jgi:16S rRNA G527 N7-methylase RsmG